MADYGNHHRFTIKCLKSEVILVSIRLKTNIKTSKGLQIIRRAEKQLLNECVRSINNTLELLMLKSDTCIQELEDSIQDKEVDDHKTFEECVSFIKRVRECRHNKAMHRQKLKYEALQWKKIGCSNKGQNTSTCTSTDNMTEDMKKWVKTLSNTPLTIDQERLLAHGPKFVIKPKKPPVGEYIAAVEQACSRLTQGEADELQVEVRKTLKKEQNQARTSSNITQEEFRALKELKEDKSRMILTADKWVALVIMDKNDYIHKAKELLNTNTYKKITEDPTNKQNKLVNILKNISSEGGLSEDTYKRLYPTGAVPSKFYGWPKIHKPGIPLRAIVSSTGTATYNTA